MTGYIYKITSPKGRIYIGSTIEFNYRLSQYKRYECKSQTKIYNSLKKYGWENHTFEVIEEPLLKDMLSREAYWGEYYDVLSRNNLNCNLPKVGDTYKGVSEETREKIRLSRIGTKASNETKEKMSASRKGRVVTEETRLKISNKLMGHTHSEETRKKISKTKSLNKTIPANARIVFDTINGIYYDSCKEASESTIWSHGHLSDMLRGKYKNKTNLIYV